VVQAALDYEIEAAEKARIKTIKSHIAMADSMISSATLDPNVRMAFQHFLEALKLFLPEGER